MSALALTPWQKMSVKNERLTPAVVLAGSSCCYSISKHKGGVSFRNLSSVGGSLWKMCGESTEFDKIVC